MKDLEENKLMDEMVKYQHLYNIMMMRFQELIHSQKDIDVETHEAINSIYWDLLDK